MDGTERDALMLCSFPRVLLIASLVELAPTGLTDVLQYSLGSSTLSCLAAVVVRSWGGLRRPRRRGS
jgi:hypothetical protein